VTSASIERSRAPRTSRASYPGGGLVVDEVIEFSHNYYASIREKDSGVGAFEVLIDRATGNVTREPGPDMMWNAKYSTMGGTMMGRSVVVPSGSMTVTGEEARAIAQRWLDSNRPHSTAKPPDAFYGYYTLDFESSGQVAGMLYSERLHGTGLVSQLARQLHPAERARHVRRSPNTR